VISINLSPTPLRHGEGHFNLSLAISNQVFKPLSFQGRGLERGETISVEFTLIYALKIPAFCPYFDSTRIKVLMPEIPM
jgi:hypothetical protein